MDHKTELIDLNYDCLLLVLEQLDFMSLVSLAETNIRYNSIVSEIVKPIFRNRMVNIATSQTGRPIDITIENDFIRIENFTFAERVVKNLGHVIHGLKLNGAYPQYHNATRSIYQLVNLHCAQTLNEIWFGLDSNDFMDELTNTFESVESVHLWDTLKTKRNLSAIFPAIRNLYIVLYEASHAHLINVNYAYLENLNIYMYKNDIGGPLIDGLVSELIKLNPHVRSLRLERVSTELIKIAADSMPQLEQLELIHMESNYKNGTINFGNVKIFTANGTYINTLFRNVKFGNVEELNVNSLAESMFRADGFFESNKNLKKLRLMHNKIVYLNNHAFRLFRDTKTALQDIFIRPAAITATDTLVELINLLYSNNEQLETLRIEFLPGHLRETILGTLRDGIGEACSMDAFENTIIFKRKNTLL